MKKITYKSSGVDIAKANAFVSGIQSAVRSTLIPGVIQKKGSFGALFGLDVKKYKNPVLVSSTDGVGTKLMIAQKSDRHNTVGIDLVAMNVNDILCVGAKPLFFLDYIACGKVKLNVLKDVVEGIAEGCRQSGCAIIGGETAEMPGIYSEEEYDLAGFVVGVVEKNKMIDGSKIRAGDVVVGLPSSGLHSNGYSLVRKALSAKQQHDMADVLLTPTRIYVKEVLPMLSKFTIKGIAHLTGGAYYEKLTKILPDGLSFVIDRAAWTVPEIFQLIQKQGNVDDAEMFRTFNMGVGMALVLARKDFVKIAAYLTKNKIVFYRMGSVVKGSSEKVQFING